MTRTASQPKPAKVAKSQYKPHIRRESATTFAVPSESYGGHILYTVTVADDGSTSCDCTAGSFGRTCKHQALVAGFVAYSAHPSHIREQVAEVVESAPALPAPIEIASRRKPVPAFIPAPDDLMEAFGL